MRAVKFVLWGEDAASDHHYRVTAGPASVEVIDVPDNVSDNTAEQLLNKTVLLNLSHSKLIVQFQSLGVGKVVSGHQS